MPDYEFEILGKFETEVMEKIENLLEKDSIIKIEDITVGAE